MKENYLEMVNKFTRRPFKEDEIYVFDVVLCDNRQDRDREMFSDRALEQMKGLFLGKTGIFDHDPKGENQTARIFDTSVVEFADEKNDIGKTYKQLRASCYMVRTQKGADLIKEIDGGIKKEVSVSCSAGRKVCSVCGKDVGKCSHRPGSKYGGKLCCHILDDIKDAYEWSFVAVPAQIEAGVTKKYCGETFNNVFNNVLKTEDVEMVEKELKKDICRIYYFSNGQKGEDIMQRMLENMNIRELIELKNDLEKKYKPRAEKINQEEYKIK